MKDEPGLDPLEGRTWPGWNRHGTPVSVADHFLVDQKLEGQKKTDPPPGAA
jgi:SRSO17 transposase